MSENTGLDSIGAQLKMLQTYVQLGEEMEKLRGQIDPSLLKLLKKKPVENGQTELTQEKKEKIGEVLTKYLTDNPKQVNRKIRNTAIKALGVNIPVGFINDWLSENAISEGSGTGKKWSLKKKSNK